MCLSEATLRQGCFESTTCLGRLPMLGRSFGREPVLSKHLDLEIPERPFRFHRLLLISCRSSNVHDDQVRPLGIGVAPMAEWDANRSVNAAHLDLIALRTTPE
jgi:hypothetical protein